MFTPITLDHAEFFATVTFRETTGTFRLRWTDRVCQDETEEFPSLDAALARLALLVLAVETDTTMRGEAQDFAERWAEFGHGNRS